MQDTCLWSFCFYPLTGNESRFFGFAEFLAALALMVLAWTTTDARYRFRVRTAPLPMPRMTFWIVFAVGLLTLLTDLWRAERWYVPRGTLISPAEWQAVLGAVLFFAFLAWIWFAFMRPPRYHRLTAKRYADALYGVLLRADSGDLAVVADEMGASIEALIKHAPTETEWRLATATDPGVKLIPIRGYAHDVFQVLADPRFVKALVDAAPRTALEIFFQMGKQKRVPLGLSIFARNFVTEAVSNKQSFLYRETAAYKSGLLGSLKPLTSAMFSSYETVHKLSTMLDVAYPFMRGWDNEQLEAYGRLVLLAFKACVRDGYVNSHPAIFYRALDTVANATGDAYKLNGMPSIDAHSDVHARLYAAVRIITECVAVLDAAENPIYQLGRERSQQHHHTIYDAIAKTIDTIIFNVSTVRGPRYTCWAVQHNAVWGQLFNFDHLDGPAGRVIKHKVRRLLYDETIGDMERFPNYKAAKLVGYCLNILGHRPNRNSYSRDSNALQRLIVRWLKTKYVRLHETHPDVAEHCLLDEMSYDTLRRRIVFTRPGRLGQKKPRLSYLQLD